MDDLDAQIRQYWRTKPYDTEDAIDAALLNHRILTAGTYDTRRYVARSERPGEFKKGDYATGIHEVGSPPEEVEPALRELVDELNTGQGDNPLAPAAYLHARFEHIHPFADGNGRTGRTLTNYWLMCRNHPPIVVFEEERKAYDQALEQYDAEETLQPMIDFLRAQTIRTWSGALRRSRGDTAGLRRKGLQAHIGPH